MLEGLEEQYKAWHPIPNTFISNNTTNTDDTSYDIIQSHACKLSDFITDKCDYGTNGW